MRVLGRFTLVALVSVAACGTEEKRPPAPPTSPPPSPPPPPAPAPPPPPPSAPAGSAWNRYPVGTCFESESLSNMGSDAPKKATERWCLTRVEGRRGYVALGTRSEAVRAVPVFVRPISLDAPDEHISGAVTVLDERREKVVVPIGAFDTLYRKVVRETKDPPKKETIEIWTTDEFPVPVRVAEVIEQPGFQFSFSRALARKLTLPERPRSHWLDFGVGTSVELTVTTGHATVGRTEHWTLASKTDETFELSSTATSDGPASLERSDLEPAALAERVITDGDWQVLKTTSRNFGCDQSTVLYNEEVDGHLVIVKRVETWWSKDAPLPVKRIVVENPGALEKTTIVELATLDAK